MSKFHVSLIVTILALIAAAVGLHGIDRVVTIAVIVASFVVLFSVGIARISLQFFVPTVLSGRVGKMQIALTFDDGPDPASTPALLDFLAREKIPAAFFCIGKHVAAHPEIARRIVAEGHLIGNHSYHHGHFMMFNRGRGWAREMKLGQDAIREATGQTPELFRPPIGLTSPHFKYALRVNALKIIGWSVRPRDTIRPADVVIEHILKETRDGSIILLHDGGTSGERIVGIVEALVKELRSRGFRFERVDRMID